MSAGTLAVSSSSVPSASTCTRRRATGCERTATTSAALTIGATCSTIWPKSSSRCRSSYQSSLLRQTTIRFSILASTATRSRSYALSGPSTTNSTRSAFLAATADSAARDSPRTSARPGVSTSTIESPAGQGISLRVTVVPPTTLERNTSRPASAFKSDDLPLEIVPNATISSRCDCALGFEVGDCGFDLAAQLRRDPVADRVLLAGSQVVAQLARAFAGRHFAGAEVAALHLGRFLPRVLPDAGQDARPPGRAAPAHQFRPRRDTHSRAKCRAWRPSRSVRAPWAAA